MTRPVGGAVPSDRVSRRTEAAFAAVSLSVIFLFYATDLSVRPDVWRFSYRDLARVLVVGAVAVGFLYSYRLRLPHVLAGARSFATVAMTTLLVAFLLGEVVLRATDRMPYSERPNQGRHLYDEDVGHVYRPNFEQTLQTREWRQEWRSNAQGVRADRDFGAKADGVIRILLVGDSFTVGDQVPVDSTYPAVVQRLLDERHGTGRFEVVNAGFPAYGTVHEARYISKFGGRFDPDVVLVGMTPNDLLENRTPRGVISRDGALIRRGALDRLPVARDRQRWYNLRGHFLRTEVRRSLQSFTTGSRPYVHRRAFMAEPDSAARAQYDLAERYLTEAREAAEELGASFGFFTIPFRAQFADLPVGLDPEVFGERWSEFAVARGVPFVDVYPAFRRHPDPMSLYWVEDGHCNAAGYDLIGRTVYQLIVDEAEALGLELDE